MDALFLKILNMSIAASWLIIAVILLRLILKKTPKWINVLLWGIVAIRVICPFSFESSVSLIPASVGNGELVSQWADDYIGEIDIYHPDSIYYDAAIGAGREPISDGEGGYYVVTKHDQLGEPATIENTIVPILSVVWLTGIVVVLIYAAVSYFRLKRKVGASLHLQDNIRICDDIQTPFILGCFKPRIYIPSGTDEAQLSHIIAHENAHLKRRDHWWKPLGFAVLAIHWFNPLVWVAYILLCRDIELACDEKVIRELNQSESIAYSEALLSCSVNRRMVMVCPLAFGEVGVKERVKRVLNYKKPAFWIVIVAIISCIIIAVCFLTNPKQDSFKIRIVVPAGTTQEIVYQEDFVYSDEEISPIGNKITISAGEGLGDTEVVLKPIEVKEENAYEPTYLTPGMPIEMDVEKGAWFKIGVNMQNPTDKDIIVYLEVKGIEIRISDESTPTSSNFNATILEIKDSYYLVEPVEGSWELSSADQIEVPLKMLDPSLEPEVGDIIEIEYSGEILETYPARITDVYGIRIVEESEQWDLIPMVMVNGTLYLDTGNESTVEGRCGVMDGEITSTVANTEQPTKNDQSNFGFGYEYQYGSTEGTIEIYINKKWQVFATEKVIASSELMIDQNNSEESITYNGKEYKKSELCNATLNWLELSETDRLLSSYFPPEFLIFDETWGITLTAENITPTGVIIKCTQSDGKPTGELQTGGWYIVENWTQENGWKEVSALCEPYWTDIAYMIPKDDTTEWNVNWERIYGKLPEGKYRIGKEIMDFRASGDYDTAIYYVEFEITE